MCGAGKGWKGVRRRSGRRVCVLGAASPLPPRRHGGWAASTLPAHTPTCAAAAPRRRGIEPAAEAARAPHRTMGQQAAQPRSLLRGPTQARCASALALTSLYLARDAMERSSDGHVACRCEKKERRALMREPHTPRPAHRGWAGYGKKGVARAGGAGARAKGKESAVVFFFACTQKTTTRPPSRGVVHSHANRGVLGQPLSHTHTVCCPSTFQPLLLTAPHSRQ